MRVDDAIALLISANNARAIAIRTLRRAEKDIETAEKVLIYGTDPDVLKIGKVFTVDGYTLTRTRKRTRRQVDQAKLLAEWEDLPQKVRDRFDSVFVGTVGDLEELLGQDGAAPYFRTPVGDETVQVREIRSQQEEKQERIEFGG
jgi:hypothetical protein